MAYKNIIVTQDQRILTVTINRPKVHNALDPDTQAEMEQAFDDFEQNNQLWVAIVTGAGNKAFSAGGDIQAITQLRLSGAANASDFKTPAKGYGGLTSRFSLTKPVIAAVNGLAMGGGFEIVLACDIAIAAEHASFGLPEPKIGVAAMAGGMHRLPRQIGLKPAMEMLLTAEPLSAKRAYELGLINKVVQADDVLSTAMDYAHKIIACSPSAIRATKQCAIQGLSYPGAEQAIAAQEQGEFDCYNKMFTTEDFTEGLVAFTEKRHPIWKNR